MNINILLSSALLALTPALAQTVFAQPKMPSLTIAAESHDQLWNGVVRDKQGRLFLSVQRWSGSKPPSLSVMDAKGHKKAYPDAVWNGWKPGDDPSKAFVNINAIHLGRDGDLWIIDTGAAQFGGDPLPNGAKLVRIDLVRNKVKRVYMLGSDIAKPGSYIDDMRFGGKMAYLTDAGQAGLIVLDIETGIARRVLDNHRSTTARLDRDVTVDGQLVKGPDGAPLRVHADPLDLSPDGQWLYYAPLAGPWSKIETKYLDDASVTSEQLESHIEPFADLPPTGGTQMGPDGSLYFTDLEESALKVRRPDGEIQTLFKDKGLHWGDAPFLDPKKGVIWIPAPQLDRVAVLNGGKSRVEWPMRIYRYKLPATLVR